jgi:hypothetical protein
LESNVVGQQKKDDFIVECIETVAMQHLPMLSAKRKEKLGVGEYGEVDYSTWHGHLFTVFIPNVVFRQFAKQAAALNLTNGDFGSIPMLQKLSISWLTHLMAIHYPDCTLVI